MASEEQNEAMIGLLRRSLTRDDAGGSCPEPELLAAYFEHSLAHEEAAQFDRHVSTCSRCREQLAMMVRADDMPPKSKTMWLLDWRLLAAAAAVMVIVTVWATRHPGRPASVSQNSNAPLAAVSKEGPSNDLTPAPTSENDLTALPPSSRETDKTAKPARVHPPAGVPQSSAAERADDKKAASTDAVSDSVSGSVAGSIGKQSANNQVVDTKSAEVGTAQQQSGAGGIGQGSGQGFGMARAQNARVGHAAGGQQQPAQQLQAQKQVQRIPASSQMVQVEASPQPVSPSTAAAPSAPASARSANDSTLGATNQSETAESAQEPQARTMANAKTKQALASAYAENGAALQTLEERSAEHVIDTPIPSVKWRITAAGFVERSEDGGATWQGQEPDPEAHLVAGSAPTERVCWLVGKEGVVLVTKDAANWKKIPPPVAADLTSVSAKSASAATVTTADGRRFTTHNEGKKWKPVE
jgi:hypothetical protein